jgi:hypothetical protein
MADAGALSAFISGTIFRSPRDRPDLFIEAITAQADGAGGYVVTVAARAGLPPGWLDELNREPGGSMTALARANLGQTTDWDWGGP